jgi:monoamine oxidase
MTDFWIRLDQVLAKMKRNKRDESFADFTVRHRSIDRKTLNLVTSYIEGFNAADSRKISTRALIRAEADEDEIEATKLYRLADGYDRVVRWLADGSDPQHLEIHLAHVVRRVEWKQGAVTVAAAGWQGGEETFTARRAIITLPLGVLKAGASVPGAVQFVPDLDDDKRAAIAHLESGAVVKVMLRFDEPFWETQAVPAAGEKLTEAGFLHADLAVPGIVFPTWWTTAALRTPVLTAWVGGPQALQVSGVSDERVLAHAIESLARLTGFPARDIERRLHSHRIADWQSDPFARGAYSYVAVGGNRAVETLAAPLAKTLFFAGEATHPGMSGTVAGAIATGYRAADEVLTASAGRNTGSAG